MDPKTPTASVPLPAGGRSRQNPCAALLATLFLTASLGGCAEIVNPFSVPDYHVQATPLATGYQQWNRDNVLEVRVAETGVEVRIDATDQATGSRVSAQGIGSAQMKIPDGTWSITATVGGHKWLTLSPVQVDATPPTVTGLETVGAASAGAYTLGSGATVEPDARVRVTDAQTGAFLGDHLPLALSGLADGLHLYHVAVVDTAGNYNNATIQVRAGNAAGLPAGQHTLGIVARYTDQLRLWDISRPDAYLGRAAAQQSVLQATGKTYMGPGYGITPDDPDVQGVVRQAVTGNPNTLEAALALYHWMADHLRYNTSRLDATSLLTPEQTLHDGGGVCRDLAALYVSLLRGAGVPARLVAGYLAGNVNGFHAWAEFYAGPVGGQSPWVPVDVSSIHGTYDVGAAMQAFGILLPDHLSLRAISPAEEGNDWSQAVNVTSSYRNTPPQVEAANQVTTLFQDPDRKDLCLNVATQERALAEHGRCGMHYDHFLPDFLWSVIQVIDYGVQVTGAEPGTSMHARIAYPMEASVLPNQVEWQVYGSKDFTQDPGSGMVLTHDTF